MIMLYLTNDFYKPNKITKEFHKIGVKSHIANKVS